jgi:hypothetical protein
VHKTILFLSFLGLAACQKENEPTPIADTRTPLLLAKNWQLSAQTTTFTDNGKAQVMDVYASTAPCARDNYTTFRQDKSLTYNEGKTLCGPSALLGKGSWSFNSELTELTIDSPQLHGAPSVFQVLDLTDRTLQLRHTYTYSQDSKWHTGVEDYVFTAL